MVSEDELQAIMEKCAPEAKKLFAKGAIDRILFDRNAYDILREQKILELPEYNFFNQASIDQAAEHIMMLALSLGLKQSNGLKGTYLSLAGQTLTPSQQKDVEKYETVLLLAKRYITTVLQVSQDFDFDSTVKKYLRESPDVKKIAPPKVMEVAEENIKQDLEYLARAGIAFDSLKNLRGN